MTTPELTTNLIQAPYYAETHVLGDWATHADKAVLALAKTREPFTTDDIRAQVPSTLKPRHPNAWGGLLNAWAHRGLIRPIGYVASRHQPRRGGVQRQWVGTGQPLEG